MTRRALALPIALLLALAACTPGEPEFTANEQVAAQDRSEEPAEGDSEAAEDEAAGGDVTFAAGNQIAWDEVPDSIPAGGATVELVCDNLQHNVTIDGTEVVACDAPGEYTGNVDLEPGTYEYTCTVPGHEAGMSGEIEVS